MDKLLEVRGLRTYFHTDRGLFRAVDGIDFSVDRGKTVGLVGESGCGKSVTSLSVMGLVPSPPGKVEAEAVLFGNRDVLRLSADERRKLRGGKMSMIFQEPMTSLNPVFTVGEQIAEAVRLHQGAGTKEALARARASSFVRPKCRTIVSVICVPIVSVGLSEVIGSWKIIAISAPRTRRSSSSGAPISSVPW